MLPKIASGDSSFNCDLIFNACCTVSDVQTKIAEDNVWLRVLRFEIKKKLTVFLTLLK